ncbi:MAG TPA: ABC transporter substrate binding protein [Hyphomicrobiaceae bacterium]|nr:ABC transporter substrate binding protein [Hyphomicrobiaceae bacterium]
MHERFPQLAAELLRLKVDLIVTRGRIVSGLANPGGNVTGLSGLTTELVGKRVELLRETVAGLTRIGLAQNMGNPIEASQWEEFKVAAASLGIEARLFDVRRLEDVAPAFDAAVAQRINGRIVANDTILHANRTHVVELAAKASVASVVSQRGVCRRRGIDDLRRELS